MDVGDREHKVQIGQRGQRGELEIWYNVDINTLQCGHRGHTIHRGRMGRSQNRVQYGHMY